ncbi:MAG: FAD-binding oxidoreductase [Bacteroidota bacterium]
MKSLTVIDALINHLGPSKVLTGEDVKERYFHIWQMDEPLSAKAVLLPQSTADVSAMMKICHAHHQPVVTHGGRTNLVGSTETNANEIVISMEKMNRIEEIDPKSRTITVQSGAILETVQQAAAENKLLFPLNFGAKGSAQIGGAISTNAGGLRVLRFGMTRNLVLGLESVLADGRVISSMKKIIKDNSAYDLKHMFIGSEGTLGIITRAVLKLIETPKSRNSALVGLDSYDKVVAFLKYMDSGLAGTLSGYELMWKVSYQALTSLPSLASPPLPYDYPYYVLLECLGSDQEQDMIRLHTLLEDALAQDLIVDAAPTQSYPDNDRFWAIREEVGAMVSHCTYEQQFDVSLPIPLIGEFVESTVEKLQAIPEVEQVFMFGHVADGNIHFIVGKPNQDAGLTHAINEVIYLPLQEIGGSVSAEHGIGVHKKAYLSLSRSEEEIQLMKDVKRSLDPRNILNPGKVLDM